MQLSDWEQRPLSNSQMTYAALDAHCLVQIATAIRNSPVYVPSHSCIGDCPASCKRFLGMLCSDGKHRKGNGAREPSWTELSNAVSTLTVTSQLSGDSTLEHVQHRVKYQASWMQRVRKSRSQASLVTPQELQTFWNERICEASEKLGGSRSDDAELTQMKLIPYDALKVMMKQIGNLEPYQSFCPVNSICLFAAGTYTLSMHYSSMR